MPDESIPLDIVVDPAAINEYVAKAIIESALGERLHKTVEEALKAFGSYGNDPLKSAVTSEVQKQMIKFVQTEFRTQIEQAVREQMTSEWINSLVTSFMHSVNAQISKSY